MNPGKILIINNDGRLSNYLKLELTKKGYTVFIAIDTTKVFEDLRNTNFDLIMVRYGMLNTKIKELISQIKKIDSGSSIVAILDKMDFSILQDISRLGIYGHIVQPIDLEKLSMVVKKGIEFHSVLIDHRKAMEIVENQRINLQKQNTFLNKRVEELTKNLTRLYENLRTTYMRTIKALAQTIDARDHYTHSHSENVSIYAVKIAEAMELPTQDTEMIRQACELHDIGKIGIADQILSKETPLSSQEMDLIKLHPLKGSQILEPLDFLGKTVVLVCEHHENYDGTGYPYGHRDEQIPLGARIIRVADAYDAMTSARAYRKIPLSKEEAMAEIKKNSGKQFDPKVVQAFLKVVNEL